LKNDKTVFIIDFLVIVNQRDWFLIPECGTAVAGQQEASAIRIGAVSRL